MQCGRILYEGTQNLCGTCRHLFWSEEETAYLRGHYPIDGAKSVADALGRTVGQVRSKANKLNVHVAEEAKERLVHDVARTHMKSNNPMWDPASLAKMKRWQQEHPEYRSRIKNMLRECNRTIQRDRPSGLERRLHAILKQAGIAFASSVLINNKFVVDVQIGSLIVQADGEYWHGHSDFVPLTERQIAQQRRDRSQDAYLRACGYAVVRLWDRDVNQPTVMAMLRSHKLITSAA